MPSAAVVPAGTAQPEAYPVVTELTFKVEPAVAKKPQPVIPRRDTGPMSRDPSGGSERVPSLSQTKAESTPQNEARDEAQAQDANARSIEGSFPTPLITPSLVAGALAFSLIVLFVSMLESDVCVDSGASFKCIMDTDSHGTHKIKPEDFKTNDGEFEKFSISSHCDSAEHWLAHWTALLVFCVSFILDCTGLFLSHDNSKRSLLKILVFVNGIALLTYILLVIGAVPLFEDRAGRLVYVLRYLQWSFSCPALILLLGVLAGWELADLLLLMACDWVMIVTGLLAILSQDTAMVAVFAVVSFGCWVPVMRGLAVLHDDAAARAIHPDDETSLRRLRLVSIVAWTAFPLLFTLSLCEFIPQHAAEYAVCATDCLCKVVYSMLIASQNFMDVKRTDLLFELGGEAVYTDLDLTMKRLDQATRMFTEGVDTVASGSIQSTSFLKTMSHELLTPLNAIINFNEMLLESEKLDSSDAVKARESLLAAERLLGAINNMLDYNNIQTLGISWAKDEFNFEEIVMAVMRSLNTFALTRNVRFTLCLSPELPSCVVGDKRYVHKILFNVVHNAIKFTDWVGRKTGSQLMVSVAVAVESRDGDDLTLCVTVTDQGIGIAADRLKDWCKPFCALTSSSDMFKFGGPGVGLAIVRRVLSRCEGTIDVASMPGTGTVVKMHIPMSVLPQESDAPNPRERRIRRNGSLRGRRVAVLLDSADLNQVAPLLAAWGVDTTTCEPASDHLEEARAEFTSGCKSCSVVLASIAVFKALAGESLFSPTTKSSFDAVAARRSSFVKSTPGGGRKSLMRRSFDSGPGDRETVDAFDNQAIAAAAVAATAAATVLLLRLAEEVSAGSSLVLLGSTSERDGMAHLFCSDTRAVISCTFFDNSPVPESRLYALLQTIMAMNGDPSDQGSFSVWRSPAAVAAIQGGAEGPVDEHSFEDPSPPHQPPPGSPPAQPADVAPVKSLTSEAVATPAAAPRPRPIVAAMAARGGLKKLQSTHFAPLEGCSVVGSRALRVLITDDIPMNRKVLGAMCKRMDVEFDYAEDGNVCVAKCKTVEYDLVLMDVQMPECDGLQATKQLRALARAGLLAGQGGADRTGGGPYKSTLAIIGCSANSQDLDIIACYEAGMDDFIAKPVRFPVFENVVNNCMKKTLLVAHAAEKEQATRLMRESPGGGAAEKEAPFEYHRRATARHILASNVFPLKLADEDQETKDDEKFEIHV